MATRFSVFNPGGEQFVGEQERFEEIKRQAAIRDQMALRELAQRARLGKERTDAALEQIASNERIAGGQNRTALELQQLAGTNARELAEVTGGINRDIAGIGANAQTRAAEIAAGPNQTLADLQSRRLDAELPGIKAQNDLTAAQADAERERLGFTRSIFGDIMSGLVGGSGALGGALEGMEDVIQRAVVGKELGIDLPTREEVDRRDSAKAAQDDILAQIEGDKVGRKALRDAEAVGLEPTQAIATAQEALREAALGDLLAFENTFKDFTDKDDRSLLSGIGETLFGVGGTAASVNKALGDDGLADLVASGNALVERLVSSGMSSDQARKLVAEKLQPIITAEFGEGDLADDAGANLTRELVRMLQLGDLVR